MRPFTVVALVSRKWAADLGLDPGSLAVAVASVTNPDRRTYEE